MSRITSHCQCQNIDVRSKALSFTDNYFDKSSELFINHQNKLKFHKSSQHDDCKMCKNYENIENFLSGTFRPHSCPSENYEGRDHLPVNVNNQRESDKFHRKCSKTSLKHAKLHDQMYSTKNVSNDGIPHRLDTIHQGLNLYINNGSVHLADSPKVRAQQRSTGADKGIFSTASNKKSSCGFKYILFRKLSIVSHFIKGTKSKSASLSANVPQFSDENLFKDNYCQTKRSKSFHTIDNKDRRQSGNVCSHNFEEKPLSYTVKESEKSNSSAGSIDAHAGSPTTILSYQRRNVRGGIPNNFVTNTLVRGNNTPINKDCRDRYTSPEMREFSYKRHIHQQKAIRHHPHVHSRPFCAAHENEPCSHCSYPIPQPYHHILCDPMCHPHCHLHSPIPTQFLQCHCQCINHSHIVMHSPCPHSPSACCNQSNYLCHAFHHLHQQNIARSSLCHSCQSKNNPRCRSEKIDDNWRTSEQSNIVWSPNDNIQSNLKAANKMRPSKLSPSSHSKSVTSSIPPPPPPPPSSLYSTTKLQKNKHRKHCDDKEEKLCESCRISIPKMTQSPDCANTVQNIIYSHLNNTDPSNFLKVDDEKLTQLHDLSYSYDNSVECATKILQCKHSKGKHSERNEKECYKDKHQLCTSKRNEIDCDNQRELSDNQGTYILKDNITNYMPKFLSKTPETYKPKGDRRHKKHRNDNQNPSKHRIVNSSRDYKFVDNDVFYRDDSLDSPEAGSFIYHPISPSAKKNCQKVAPKIVSSFNSRMNFNYKDISFAKTESVRKAFQENMLSLREVGWYWGPLSFVEAERLMENKANGTFLVRDSGHDTYFLSLTFRIRETTYHTRIEYSQGTFSFWSQPESHSATTIVDFVDKAVAHSQSGKFHYFLLTNVPGQPPMEVSLLYPLSRYQIVHSLKHLSRFIILSHIRTDHIVELSVPPVLRSYLLEKQYYISNLEDFIDTTQDAYPLSYKPSTFA